MNENVNIGTKEIGAIADEDDNPDEVIGFLSFSTTGELHVPREWLLEQWEEHNLPNRLLPTETTNWQAYRRAIQYMKEQTEFLEYEVYNEHFGRTFGCELSIEKSKEHGSNVFLVYARTFFPEEIIGEEGGNYDEQRVGMFDFFRPEETEGGMTTTIEVEEDSAHYEHVKEVMKEARSVEKEMRKTHNFNDLNGILEKYRDVIADAVEIRRSVYFIPAMHGENLEDLMNVWGKMNQFKDGGEAIRIDRTPVVDMKEQRELVASRVRDKLEEMVDDIVSEIISEFEDDAEKTADMAANEIMEQLGEGGSGKTASTYNQLLGLRLSIKEILEDQREDLKEESEEVIENVLNQQTFDEIEE